MPEIKELETTAGDIQVEDQLLTIHHLTDVRNGKNVAKRVGEVNNVAVVITSVDRAYTANSKNVKLGTPHGVLTIALDAEVRVARWFKTDAEKAAELDAYIDESLDRFVKRITDEAQVDVVGWLNTKLAGYEYDVAAGLSWHTEEALVMSHRKRYAEAFVNMLKSSENGVEAVDLRDVFMAWCDTLQRDVMSGARNLSRSTSPMSNLSDDCKVKAAAVMLEGDYGLSTSWIRHRILKGGSL